MLIRVEAAAVNFPDTLIIQGRYQPGRRFPSRPGGEVAGTIEALGAGVAGPAPGTRVLAMCGHGGFAELACAPAENVVALPDGIDAVTAASLSYAYGTVLHALRDRAALRPGETVLVLGAGGRRGMAALQVARIMGARVIAAASPAKHAACLAAGAAAVVDYTAEELAGPDQGAGAGGRRGGVRRGRWPLCEPALRSIAWGGRYLVVGFAAGEIPRIPLNLALLKGCGILGVLYGTHVKREPEANRALDGAVVRMDRHRRAAARDRPCLAVGPGGGGARAAASAPGDWQDRVENLKQIAALHECPAAIICCESQTLPQCRAPFRTRSDLAPEDQPIHGKHAVAGADQWVHVDLRDTVALVGGQFRDAADDIGQGMLVHCRHSRGSPPSRRWPFSRRSMARAASSPTGASAVTVSRSNSTKMPPSPTTTIGPNSGSRFAPTTISTPAAPSAAPARH